jgi:hypothetical protein
MKKSIIINVMLAFFLVSLFGCSKDDIYIKGMGPIADGDYYVATWGNDNNPGSFDSPWATWQKAFETAEAGDKVYFRGGIWYPTDYVTGNSITIIAPTYIDGIYTGTLYGHDGTAVNPICFFNYPGETPILDCSLVNIEGHEYNNGLEIYGADFIHFKGLTIRNVYQTKVNDVAKVASGIGPYVCSNLTFENITVHDIGGRGFSVSATVGFFGITSDTTRWINCDVYNCADMLSMVPGNAADGWKCDGEAGGYFYFKGCRVWNCTDDGIDVSGSVIAVYDNCWAFNMGFKGAMDGNGFKFGGNRGIGAYISDGVLILGTPITESIRIVTNCLAAFNGASGFYDLEYVPYYRNNSRVYNNISYHNGTGFTGSPNNDFPEYLTHYRNNIAYASTELTPTGDPYSAAIFGVYPESHNTWDAYDPSPGSWPYFVDTDTVTVSDDDFISLNPNGLSGPRQADGSLPELNFLRLKNDSDLKGAGTDVGMSNSPDIGIDWDFLRSRGKK